MKVRRNETKDFALGGARVRVLHDDQSDRAYYEVSYSDGWEVAHEVVWVGNSLIAVNNARRKHGTKLLNITNLETGELVFGATR